MPIAEFSESWEDLQRRGLDPKIRAYLDVMKVPSHLVPWQSKSHHLNAMYRADMRATFMFDALSISRMHLLDDKGFGGYTIMDDSDRECLRHMQAIKVAHGRVLKTGLGLGCFVRACLSKPEVTHIDVIEIDPEIVAHFGSIFKDDPRVTIHQMDAFDFNTKQFPKDHWDLAWHDIYCDANDGLQPLHVKLMKKYRRVAKLQGAWALPRFLHRLTPVPFVGLPKPKVLPSTLSDIPTIVPYEGP